MVSRRLPLYDRKVCDLQPPPTPSLCCPAFLGVAGLSLKVI